MFSRLRSNTNMTFVFMLLGASMLALSLVDTADEPVRAAPSLFPSSELELLVTEEEEIVVEVPLLDV